MLCDIIRVSVAGVGVPLDSFIQVFRETFTYFLVDNGFLHGEAYLTVL